jgi:hypothetical protein
MKREGGKVKRLDVGTGKFTGRVNKPNRKNDDLLYNRVVGGDQFLIPASFTRHLEGHNGQHENDGQAKPGQFLDSNGTHTLSIVSARVLLQQRSRLEFIISSLACWQNLAWFLTSYDVNERAAARDSGRRRRDRRQVA